MKCNARNIANNKIFEMWCSKYQILTSDLGHSSVRCEDWWENIGSSDSWFVDGVNAHFQIEFQEHRISVALQTEVFSFENVLL